MHVRSTLVCLLPCLRSLSSIVPFFYLSLGEALIATSATHASGITVNQLLLSALARTTPWHCGPHRLLLCPIRKTAYCTEIFLPLPPYDSKVPGQWTSGPEQELQLHRIVCLLHWGSPGRRSLLAWHAYSTGWQAVTSWARQMD